MQLDEVRLFVAVVQAGSISAAARALGAPKSTISKRIAQLERRLGASLLTRTTRRLHLTNPGAVYFESASKALSELEAAENTLTAQCSEPVGVLKIAASMGSSVGVLGDVVSAFVAEYPRLHVELQCSDQRVDILANGADIAVRHGTLEDHADLIARKIGEASRKLYASPAYRERRGAPAHPNDLDQHDFLGYAGQTHIDLVGADGARLRPAVRGRFSSNLLLALRHQAIGGAGIVSLPASLAAEAIANQRLVEILPTWRSDPDPIHLLYARRKFVPMKIRVFVDFVTRRYGGTMQSAMVQQ